MKILFYIIRSELGLLMKSKTNLLYFVFGLFLCFICAEDSLKFLVWSHIALQAFIFGSMLIGYNVCTNEIINDCFDLFRSMGHRLEKYIGKLLSSYIYIIIMNMIVIVFMTIKGIVSHEDNSVIYDSIKYIVLYFILSSLVSCTIGFVIALLIKSKSAYFIIIVVSILIGYNGRTIIYALNLGQFYVNQDYNYLYGFDIESAKYLHHLVYLFSMIIIFLLLLLIKERVNKKAMIFVLCSVLLINSVLIYQYSQPVFIRNTNHTINMSKNEMKPAKFQLKSVDIHVNTKKLLQVNGDFEISLLQDTKDVSATLYRDFKISEIKLNNKKLRFMQKEDIFTVYFDDEVKKDAIVKLYISYQGLSLPSYFAGERGVLLPASFAWLPFPGEAPVLCSSDDGVLCDFDENRFYKTSPLLNDNEVAYNIQYEGDRPFVSNLNSTENRLSGKVKAGVTLVAGCFYTKEVNGRKYIYGNDYKFNKDFVVAYSDKMSDQINLIEEILGLQKTQFKTFLGVKNKDEIFAHCSDGTIKEGDALFIGNFISIESHSDERFFDRGLHALLVSNFNIYIIQDDKMSDLFVQTFSRWYKEKHNINPKSIETYDELYAKNIYYKQINEFISKQSEDQAKAFFRNWYNEMNSKKVNNTDVEKLMN